MQRIKQLFLNDRFILILILINAFTIFLQGFDGFVHWFTRSITILDSFITFLFAIEMAIKWRHYGWKAYIASTWNKLDFILVLLSLPSILFLFEEHLDIVHLNFLLVLRVSRVFKFFRFIKFIPGIEDLLKGIRRALKDSVLVLMGFFVYEFIISIFSCHLFKDISPEYFGDPLLSFYSTFRVFTVEGWYEIPEAITLNTSPTGTFFTKFYFIVILITGGVLGLSLVNSIFVDAMVSDNNDELEHKIDELTKKIDWLIEQQNTTKNS